MGPSAHISATLSCSWAKMTHATMHLWILWAFPSWIWQSKEPSRQTKGLLGKETMCACAGSPQSPRSRVGWAEAGSLLHHAELSQLRPVQRPACWPLRGTETKAATFCLPSWSWDGSAPDRDPPACEQLRARVTENNKHPLVCRKGGDEKREDVRPLPATHPPHGQAVNPGQAVPPAGLPRWH